MFLYVCHITLLRPNPPRPLWHGQPIGFRHHVHREDQSQRRSEARRDVVLLLPKESAGQHARGVRLRRAVAEHLSHVGQQILSGGGGRRRAALLIAVGFDLLDVRGA